VANTLKCWGAVSHIRNSLAELKQRPRIGKVRIWSNNLHAFMVHLKANCLVEAYESTEVFL
jgi:hypothetical protein